MEMVSSERGEGRRMTHDGEVIASNEHGTHVSSTTARFRSEAERAT